MAFDIPKEPDNFDDSPRGEFPYIENEGKIIRQILTFPKKTYLCTIPFSFIGASSSFFNTFSESMLNLQSKYEPSKEIKGEIFKIIQDPKEAIEMFEYTERENAGHFTPSSAPISSQTYKNNSTNNFKSELPLLFKYAGNDFNVMGSSSSLLKLDDLTLGLNARLLYNKEKYTPSILGYNAYQLIGDELIRIGKIGQEYDKISTFCQTPQEVEKIIMSFPTILHNSKLQEIEELNRKKTSRRINDFFNKHHK